MIEQLSADRLRELVSYDPDTGHFRRRIHADDRKGGLPAGGINRGGYRVLSIKNRDYYAHRLAVLYVTGEWPAGIVDHINGDKDDNRFSNLRDATKAINGQNLKAARSDSKTGLLGASPHRDAFVARIRSGGKSKHLGVFSDAESAHDAYLVAKRGLHEGNTL